MQVFFCFPFQDLIDDLKDELGGHFEEVIVGLMLPPEDYLCKQLNKAMDGAGTDENALIEIICTKTNDEIKEIVEAYERRKFITEVQTTLQPTFKCFFLGLLVKRRTN